MKNNKKILLGVFTLLFAFLFNLNIVNAGCNISVSSSKSASVGSNFNVSVTVPSNAGSWEYTLSYDSSKVKLVSGNLKVVGVYGDSRTSSYTFKALTEGIASFKAVNGSIYDYDSVQECFSGSGTATVNIGTKSSNNDNAASNKSKNNDLKSLSIEDATLSPEFNKGVLEYSATVPSDTESIKVSAEKEDAKANVTGTGEIKVKEGVNRIEIIVTAEDGSKKTYVINVTVEEKDPINVNVNGKKYTVVRKEDDIKSVPYNFKKTTITINKEDVLAYKNKKLNMILVGLKDEKGNVKLFIYKDKQYKELSYLSNELTNIILLDKVPNKLLYVYKKTTFKKDGLVYKGYKYIPYQNTNEYLVYGIDLNTNKKGYFVYDYDLDSIIRYSKKDLVKDNLFVIMPFIILLMLIAIILKFFKKVFTSKDKKIAKLNKRIDKLKNKKKDLFDYDEEDEEEPIITKVEDEEPLPKKTRKEKRKELMDAKMLLDKDKTSIRRISLEPDEMDDYGDF